MRLRRRGALGIAVGSSVMCALACLLVAAGLEAGGRKAGFPRPMGYVSDFASFISPRAAQTIERIARAVKQETGVEIAVVTVKTTAGEDIEEYAGRLFEDWGIGERGKDNGVLVLIAVDDRQMWIKPGYGLEGAVPDAEAFRIYRDVLRPGFRAGKSDQALVTAVNLIAQDAMKESGKAYAYGDSVPSDLLLGGGAAGAGLPSAAGQLGHKVFLSALILIFVAIAITMAMAARANQSRRGPGGLGGFWFGGFGGSSGGGFGGGFGGFGGGSAGGAGAGGGW